MAYRKTRTQDLKAGPRTKDPGPRTQDPGPRTQDPGPRTQDPGPRTVYVFDDALAVSFIRIVRLEQWCRAIKITRGALAHIVANNSRKSRNWLIFGIHSGAQPPSPLALHPWSRVKRKKASHQAKKLLPVTDDPSLPALYFSQAQTMSQGTRAKPPQPGKLKSCKAYLP